MPSPLFTLTATLQNTSGEASGSPANPAKLIVALCNYGLQLPRIVGTSNLATIIQTKYFDGAGLVSMQLWGNDLIMPGGTYYAIGVLDGENNIVQWGAYLIVGAGTFDLSTLIPLDTTNVTPPGPPPLNAALEIVPYSGAMVFHANTYKAFKTTLTGNAAASTIDGGMVGNLYTFCILQDGGGGHPFPWPSNTRNMPDVDIAPDALTTQVCMFLDDGNYYAAAIGTYYDPHS